MSEWTKFATAHFKKQQKKNPDYKFKDALKDAAKLYKKKGGGEGEVVNGADGEVVNGAAGEVVNGAAGEVVNGADGEVVNGADDDVNGADDDVNGAVTDYDRVQKYITEKMTPILEKMENPQFFLQKREYKREYKRNRRTRRKTSRTRLHKIIRRRKNKGRRI
jgi:hypothetical protein